MAYGVALKNADGTVREWFMGTLLGFHGNNVFAVPTYREALAKALEMQTVHDRYETEDRIYYFVVPLPFVDSETATQEAMNGARSS